MTILTYDAGHRPEETRAGVWGAQPPNGFGFWDPARRPGPGSARITRNYLARVQEGIWVGCGIGFWNWVIPPAPACQGPPGCEEKGYQPLICYPNFFSIFNQQFVNLYQFSMINQQLINQLLINLLFAGLQVSKLVLSTVLLYPLDYHFSINHAHALNLGWS